MDKNKNLLFLRRNIIFNQMIQDYAAYLGCEKFETISEYKNADIYIDLKLYNFSDISSEDWIIIQKNVDINEIILKDRLLRNIEFFDAKKLVYKATKFFINLFKTMRYKTLITYPVDNYITDSMVKIARYYNVEVKGISNFFIKGYKRVTVYGENTKVRDVSDDEVDNVLVLLQQQYKSYMALSFYNSLKSSFLYYFKYKIKYLHFYILYYKIFNKLEYDYRSTPYSATVNRIRDFFPFQYFTKELPTNKDRTIYIPMHYHPEATIEHWSDNVNNVDYISALVEAVRYFSDKGWSIFLKEHPAMSFRQDISIYKELKKVHNVFILNPFVETANVMKVFDNFLVWTGSTGIEALLNDKVVYFASSNYYFNKKSDEKFEKMTLPTNLDKKRFVENILKNTIVWK